MEWVWLIALLFVFVTLAYHRAKLIIWSFSYAVFLILWSKLASPSTIAAISAWAMYLIIFIPLHFSSLRYQFFTKPILNFYRQIMPTMSRTEREALAAGTVGWEGELFCGKPSWEKFLNMPKAQLTTEELDFIDGPVKTLCGMINDWEITHYLADLTPEIWAFLKEQGFFGLIIPKQYGGKEFSAYAHSQVLTMVYGVSVSVATTISVPNSLGPAELLLHYGTAEQKNYYLPRLAKGEEIPCFALTGPEAGSDASAMQDKGILCWGEWQGEKILGIRLNWDKRYITLAPVATVIGLAFKLYDPDHLLGEQENLGITCALIPRHTPGVVIGRRHFPLNTVFQNGPIQGKEVFIPMDWIIGGTQMIGQGWRMLMECLAAGRAISLPATCMGAAKAGTFATGAYARVRRQFKTSIGRFEGVEEALARMGGYTYIIDAVRTFTAAAIDGGEKPAVASAITKYHATELGRLVGNDCMDVLGGKGICLGPKNYIGRFYESIPIAITVEGANILTRSMIIFGQGAMRCHPYIFAEFEAAQNKNPTESLKAFDRALIGHMGFTLSNFVRSLVLALTNGLCTRAPQGNTKAYFQQITRFSAAFSLIADISLLVLGGSLKRKESISARLGDILSYLYLMSAVLKHYHDQGKQGEDLPLVRWACLHYLYQMQEKFFELLKNYPHRWLGRILKVFIFPWGRHFTKPNDPLTRKIAQIIMTPSAARYRLCEGAFTSIVPGNMPGELEDALLKAIAAEPVEKILKSLMKENLIKGETLMEQAKFAFSNQLISKEQLDLILQSEQARGNVIAVDDFSTDDLTHLSSQKRAYAEQEHTE